jgi:hypothetical protein
MQPITLDASILRAVYQARITSLMSKRQLLVAVPHQRRVGLPPRLNAESVTGFFSCAFEL